LYEHQEQLFSISTDIAKGGEILRHEVITCPDCKRILTVGKGKQLECTNCNRIVTLDDLVEPIANDDGELVPYLKIW